MATAPTMYHVEILKIIDASRFWAREISMGDASDEAKQFQQLTARLNNYGETAKMKAHIDNPVLGEIYIGKCAKRHGAWCRVRVDNTLHTSQGLKAQCYLVDYGIDNELIPLWHLRPIPDEFCTLPFQAKKCILHGVKPVSLQLEVNDSIHMGLGPSNRWDSSSKKFFKNLVEDSSQTVIRVITKDDSDTYHVHLHITMTCGNSFCVNDELVFKKYAVYTDEEAIFSEVSSEVSSDSQTERVKEVTRSSNLNCIKHSALSDQSLSDPDLSTDGDPTQEVRHTVPWLSGSTIRHPITRWDATERSLVSSNHNILSHGSPVRLGRSQMLGGSGSSEEPPGLSRSNISQIICNSPLGRGQSIKSSLKRSESSELVALSLGSPPDSFKPLCSPNLPLDVNMSTKMDPYLENGDAKQSSYHSQEPLFSPRTNLNFTADTLPSRELLPVIGRGRGLLSAMISMSPSKRSEETSEITCSYNQKLPVKSSEEAKLPSREPLSSSQSNHILESSLMLNGKPKNRINPISNPASTTLNERFLVLNGPLNSYQKEKSRQDNSPAKANSQVFSQKESLQSFTRAGSPFTKQIKDKDIEPEDCQIKLFGIKKLKFFRKVKDSAFTEVVKRVLHICKIDSVTGLQQYAWPALLRGHNVFGVGPREKGGKTLAYVPPLVTMLHQKDSYRNLPVSCGPHALIMAANIQKAADVHRYLMRFREEDICFRLILLSAENNEAVAEIELLNGCDVLIATPLCLLRMLSKGVTNLAGVCHLIFDDLDMLQESYSDQIEEIMRLYRKVISERSESVVAPSQMIAMSSNYNRDVERFYKTNFMEPVIIVASQLEAAYAANVKQMAIVCDRGQRAEKLISQITDNLAGSGHKIIVFLSHELEAENLYLILNSASIIALRIHHGLSHPELEQVIKQWTLPNCDNSKPVLVCTDDIIGMYDHDINDATCVIHYDVPQKKWVLGKRLWCMRRNWKSPLEKEQIGVDDAKQCLSYFYMTESNDDVASPIIKLLERSQSDIPQVLCQMAVKYEEESEKGKRTLLCDQLKAFGRCCSGRMCQLRHRIVQSLDYPGQNPCYIKVPTEGQVKVLITHVVHASRYYVRLLEVTDSDGKTHQMSTQYVDLLVDISLWYNRPNSKVQCEVPQVNKLYAFEDTQHVFNRILILEMTRSGHSKIKVLFVDNGVEQKIDVGDIIELPEQFMSIPFQAVEVYICRVKPKDGEGMWAKHINVKMASDIGNQELFGNIVLSFGCTLWLDPLVSRTRLKHLDLVVEEYSARSLLLESDQAEPNPEHLEMLYELCRGILDLPQLKDSLTSAYTINNLLVKTRSQELPTSADQDYVEVLVQAVDTPDLFYVQLKEDKQRIEQLEVDITDFVKHNQLQCPNKIRPSTLVLARFPGSNMWNRGKVSAVLSDEEYDVFFVDYGDTEVIKRADVLPMPTCFQTIPFYSIECCLVGVEAIGDGWSDDAGNLLYDITRQCVNGAEAKVLMAKVMSRASAHYSGKFVYGLELLDTTQSYCSNISHELVRHKSAKFSLLQIEELFPQLLLLPPESVETKVIQCCIDIIKSQNADEQILAAEVIQSTIQSNIRTKDVLVNHDVIQALSVVLQVRQQPEVLELVIICLVNLVNNSESLCQALWNQGGFNSLIHVLNTITDENLIEIVIWAFWQLITVKSSVMMLNRLQTYHIMSMLWSQGKIQNEKLFLDVLSTLLKRVSERDLKDVDKCGCLKVLCDKIQNLSSPKCISICFQILEDMATCESAKDKIRKNGGINAVCVLFNKWSQTEMRNKVIKTLNVLAENNIYNRDIIKEYMENTDIAGYEEQINNITGQSILQLAHVHPAFVNHKLENEPLPPECCSDNIIWRSEKPDVKWTQDRWNVLLTVAVKNVRKEDVASFTEETVTFRVIKECIEYAFEFQLYEIIVPSKCEIGVRFGSVLLGLRKKTHGLWPRLLRQKQKLPYLSVDFGRIEESSSDDDSDQIQEEPQHGPLFLAKKNRDYVPFSLVDQNLMMTRELPIVEPEEASDNESAVAYEEYMAEDDPSHKYDYFNL